MNTKKKQVGVCLLLLALLLQGCSFGKEEVKADETAEPEALVVDLPEKKIPKEMIILEKMSLEEKIAQMFVVVPEAIVDVEQVVQAGNATQKAIEKYPVGGMIYMSGNIESPKQITQMLRNVNEFSEDRIGLPMFLCVDEEGGTVVRINGKDSFGVPRVGNMSDVGASRDVKQAYQAGETIGTYLKEYGFNVDFAPNADVLTNSNNTVVKYRSFGKDPQLVAEMATAYYQGLKDQGICGSFKHFPGHGNTDGDTHEGFAYSAKTKEEIQSCELIPFEAGIENDVDFIMVGHISMPKITGSDIPATLSEEIVSDLLRREMGYEGLIITDAMNMGAISNIYGSSDSAVKAIQAGCDIVLMPSDFYSAYESVLDAVHAGKISEERIDESVLRIIKKKLEI